MSIVVEILLELLLEGGIECSTDPKVPRGIRIVAALLLMLLGIAYILLIASWAIGCCMDGRFLSAIAVGVIGIGFLGMFLWAIRKKYKENHR